MNRILTGFLKAGYAIGKSIVPEIATAERVYKGIKNGPDKKASVIEGVLLAPEIVELVEGHQIHNPALFKEGVSEINDGYVKVLKSFSPPTFAQTQPPPAAPPSA